MYLDALFKKKESIRANDMLRKKINQLTDKKRAETKI